MGSLLGELSALTRDLLIRKTAPQGGAALLTGGYDENTMRRLSNQFQTARLGTDAGPASDHHRRSVPSGNRRTDTGCASSAFATRAWTSTAALNARLARVEELLAGGIPAACAVPGQPMKQSAPAEAGAVRPKGWSQSRQSAPRGRSGPPA